MSQAYPSTIASIDKHSLEQDDIKAQFNSIVSPYGILFPEHHFQDSNIEESSPFALTFTLDQSKEPRRDLSTTFSRPNNRENGNGGRDGEVIPSSSSEGNHHDDIAHHNENDVKSFMEGYDNSEWSSSNRDSKSNKDSRNSKSGSKIVKGWKKLRESLRQSPFIGPEPKKSQDSRSSIAEETRNDKHSTSSVEIRKTVSDMDSPLELDIEEETEQVKGIRSRFRSDSLRSFLHKGSSASNLCDIDRDPSPTKGANKGHKNSLQGGAIVVDVETIMTLGRMRQYNKEDLMCQQRQNSLPEPKNTESGYGSSTSSTKSGKGDINQEPLVSPYPRDSVHELPPQSPNLDSELTSPEILNEAVPVIETEDSHDIVEESNDAVVATRSTLTREYSNSQRWRLSTQGMPQVYGTICDVEANEHYLRQLMRNSTTDEEISKDAGSSEEPDRRDRTFKVPLLQTNQLASATFENGERIPLCVYYITEELGNRGENDSLEINDLFPENWDNKDESFNNLVKTFDARPFGQGVNLSTKSQPGVIEPSELQEDSTANEEVDAEVKSENDRAEDLTTEMKDIISAEYDISSRDLSCIILHFLSEFPEPLLSQDVFTTFSSIVQLQTIDSIKIQASCLLIQMLSQEQRHLLKFLLEFLDDIIFKKMRDQINHLEQNMTESSTELSTQDELLKLDQLKADYSEQTNRITKVLGVACTQATTIGTGADLSVAKSSSQTSLYRHYKKEFESKALQEKRQKVVQESQAVFQFLMNFRISVFGPPLNSLFSSIAMENLHALSRSGSLQKQRSSGEFGQPRSGESCMRWAQSKSLMSRRLRNHLGPRVLAKRRFHSNIRGNPLASMATRRGSHSQNGLVKAGSTSSLCDSAIDIDNVDLVAQAAMQEHKARTMRSKKHMPRPSLATLHSIQVETGSAIGTKEPRRRSSIDTENSDSEMHDNDADSVTTRSTRLDFDRIEEMEKSHDEYNAENLAEEGEFNNSSEELLDRKNQEREIQIVEKEILRSEITTKFLASNLTSLYPSSSAAPIPTVILPSARAIIAQTLKTPGLSGTTSKDQGSCSRQRELTLTPQDEAKLPSSHVSTDDCVCEYCSTMIKPSKIPVLSKAEYEVAELQSQCDSKDQHIAELLKTVQSLQGQVNILNAKLLFLHDHHTTRPMRRRTLARNSFPAMPVAANGMDSSQRQRHSFQQQKSDSGMSGSQSPPGSDTMPSPNMFGLPRAFPEGVQSINNSIRQYPAGLGGSSGLSSLEEAAGEEEDDVMSFLDLDNNHSSPTSKGQYNRLLRTPSPQTTAAPNIGHAINFDRSSLIGGRDFRYETELERALREIDEMEEEPEREGEDQLDEHYYLDAYKTMDQQLYRRPILPSTPPPKPMTSEMYKKHHRMSLPIQSLMSKRISFGNSLRKKGKATPA